MRARVLLPLILLVAAAVVATACQAKSGDDSSGTQGTGGNATSADGPAASAARSSARTIVTGLHVPWGITFLPGRNGDALVAERTTGRIIRIARPGGRKSVAMKVPGVDTHAGEGGLLGLAVSPHYAQDKLVYAFYTTSHDNRIVRFKLGGKPQVILKGIVRGLIHNAGRIAFGPDGKLYAGTGEAGDSSYAQNLKVVNGKILRINPDGSIPADNPFKGSPVWSYGHRDPQGIAFDSKGRLWSSEFGQDSFDEVNLIRKGRDYGWPVVEGKGDTRGGKYVNPKVTWTTDQASPSGDAVRGHYLYVAALRGEALYRIRLNGTKTGKPVKLLAGRYGRLRTVVKAPDGSLWVATSNRDGRGTPHKGDDRIIRLK
jgi:glucose/arabinose dehydrogenase